MRIKTKIRIFEFNNISNHQFSSLLINFITLCGSLILLLFLSLFLNHTFTFFHTPNLHSHYQPLSLTQSPPLYLMNDNALSQNSFYFINPTVFIRNRFPEKIWFPFDVDSIPISCNEDEMRLIAMLIRFLSVVTRMRWDRLRCWFDSYQL